MSLSRIVISALTLTMALCVAITAGLAYWTAGVIDLSSSVDGYRIDEGPFDNVKRALMVVIVTSTVYMFSVFMGWDPIGRLTGIAGSMAGIVCVTLLAVSKTWPADDVRALKAQPRVVVLVPHDGL